MDLFNYDCFNVMPELPDNCIDLILCDLPYGVTANKKDIRLPFDKLWEQYERIIKPNGAIILFAQGIFYVDLVNSNRKLFRYDLIWDKVLTTGFLNAKKQPLRQHEQIAVFYKKPPTYNPQFTIGPPQHSKGNNYKKDFKHSENYGEYKALDEDYRKGNTEKYPTSIVRISKVHPSKATHLTQKPVELLEWIIKTYTNEGELVLDNCMGTGSTGIACANTDRRFIGIEIDRSNFDIASELIKNAILEKEGKEL